MNETVLAAADFYTGVSALMNRLDPTWEPEQWQAQVGKEESVLREILGEGRGQTVLDYSCGSGGQAIPLAKLGWRVTATDISEASLRRAREHAQAAALNIDFRACDMRDLESEFFATFDWVLSCMALDNILADAEILHALQGTFRALRPGGKLYIRLRNFDTILQEKPRYEFKEERILPNGRVIRLEDWDYGDERHLVCTYVFLHEDIQRAGYPWTTHMFSYPRRALRQDELEQLLQRAEFHAIQFLPNPNPWRPHEVVAGKPG